MREVAKKLYRGDALTDDELKALLKVCIKGRDALAELGERFQLPFAELNHMINTMKGWKRERERYAKGNLGETTVAKKTIGEKKMMQNVSALARELDKFPLTAPIAEALREATGVVEPSPHGNAPNNGVDLIRIERERQIKVEGWDPKHDDDHIQGEMAMAAACYAVNSIKRNIFTLTTKRGGDGYYFSDPWPWSAQWDKRMEHDRYRSLIIAGALIAAELDRMLRIDTAGKS